MPPVAVTAQQNFLFRESHFSRVADMREHAVAWDKPKRARARQDQNWLAAGY